MVTIQLVSEDFEAQDLLLHLEQENVVSGLKTSIVEAKKEGLSFLHDSLQFIITDETTREMAILAFKLVLPFALKKAYNHLNPDPHILIKYENGREKKIWYEGKSDIAIVRELMAEINDGEVARAFFKS